MTGCESCAWLRADLIDASNTIEELQEEINHLHRKHHTEIMMYQGDIARLEDDLRDVEELRGGWL